MDAPDFQAPQVPVTHRRRRSTVWKSTPVSVKIIALICLLGLIAIAVVDQRHRAARVRSAVPKLPPTPGETFDKLVSKTPTFDLVVEEAALNPATRRIEGVVTNRSDQTYDKVWISFYLPSKDLSAGRRIEVELHTLAPHASAEFSTEPLAQGALQWSVERISGTRR